MSYAYLNFGDFIMRKRLERKISLRVMAKQLGVSAPFLSNVEKDRRNHFDADRLEKVASLLELDDKDRELMFNIVGKRRNTFVPDLHGYIMERDYISTTPQTARDLDAGEAEWLWFMDELEKGCYKADQKVLSKD